MRRPLFIILTILLALGAVEGTAWWWMHPAPAGQGEPVLAYRPSRSAGVSPAAQKPGVSDQGSEIDDSGSKIADENDPPASSSLHHSKSNIASGHASQGSADLQGRERSHRVQNSKSSLTPLPELYAKSAPMLRCTGGQVNYAKLDETSGIHLAYFEWDGTDTGSVLEAFRHMPEACMGSIGMILVSKEKPIAYTVRGRETGDASRSESLKVKSQKSDSKTTRRLFSSSSDLRPSDLQTFDSSPSSSSIQNSKSNIASGHASQGSADLQGRERSHRVQNSSSPASSSSDLRPSDLKTFDSSSPSSTSDLRPSTFDSSSSSSSSHTLIFDHTIFRDPNNSATSLSPPVHAFRAVWVSGLSGTDARQDLAGGQFERLRSIRFKSALTRFKPAHARVIQGAVRGAANGDAAWKAFEENMLQDLRFAAP